MVGSGSRRRLLAGCLGGLVLSQYAWAQPALNATAAEIVQRNAEARGGVEAWERLQTMAWTGYVETGASPGRKLPFLLEQKRPNKTRFEIVNDGMRSVRIFDGRSGWKLKPNPASGRPELSIYSDDELTFARGSQVISGPLMDYVAKGATVAIGGHGEADGRRVYILDVKLPSGGSHRIWVDAETYLEVRHDRQVRSDMGQLGSVTVVFRDYHEFEGVKLPTKIETGAGVGVPANKLVIERVALNPDLDERMFARPETVVSRKKSIVVDTRVPAPGSARMPTNPP